MISPYLDKEVVIAQLRHEIPTDFNVDYDVMLSTGKEIDGYIAYFYPKEPMWILTNRLLGIVEGIVFSEDLEYGYSHGLVTE